MKYIALFIVLVLCSLVSPHLVIAAAAGFVLLACR